MGRHCGITDNRQWNDRKYSTIWSSTQARNSKKADNGSNLSSDIMQALTRQ
jgi:hypothetical protein